LCGHWRVLFIEGEPCSLAIVDVYKRDSASSQEVLREGPVSLLAIREDRAEFQAVEVEGEAETIYVKFCVEEFDEPEEYLRRAFEKLSLAPPATKCEDEGVAL